MTQVESSTRSVRLKVPAKPEYIVLTRLALSAVCRLTSLEPEDVADLKLAVTEAATAFVREESEEQLSCGFELEDDRLVLDIGGPTGATVSPRKSRSSAKPSSARRLTSATFGQMASVSSNTSNRTNSRLPSLREADRRPSIGTRPKE